MSVGLNSMLFLFGLYSLFAMSMYLIRSRLYILTALENIYKGLLNWCIAPVGCFSHWL